MRKIIDLVLIVGFIVVDWLIFHDLLKGGERYTVTEFLTGLLSIPVFVISLQSLFKRSSNTNNQM